MLRALSLLLLLLLLSGCGGTSLCFLNCGGGSSSVSYPSPVAGKWESWGTGASQTFSFTNSFAMPSGGQAAGYVYEVPPATLKTASAMTLNYTLTGSGTFVAPGDALPATISMFIWQSGDNLSCVGDYVNYRVFYKYNINTGGNNAPLTFGTNTVTAPLVPSTATNPKVWENCYGSALTPARWATLLANPFAVGFTFGGNSFASHGVGMATGSANFTVNSFTVK